MAQLGVRCVRGYISHTECRRCVTDPLHPCGLTVDLLELMREENDAEVKHNSFTPTRLLGCDRQTVLLGQTDFYADIDNQWPMLRGTLMHAGIDATLPDRDNVLTERRFSTPVDTRYGPQTFTGKPDRIEIQKITDGVAYVKVVDYKTVKSVDHGLTEAKRNHVMQLNMYAWLVVCALPELVQQGYIFGINDLFHSVEITELEIFYGDMAKFRRFTSAGPLQARGKRIGRSGSEYETLDLSPIPLIPHDVMTAWIVEHIERKIEAQEQLPPPLTGDAAWICPRCPVRETCATIAKEEGYS